MFFVIQVALGTLLRIIYYLILIRAILSFFPTLQTSKISYFIYQMTEPVLAPCRAILDKLGLGMGMFDFSPILAIILLNLMIRLLFYI
ncbi:MAG TPA: YggT family protein [Sedimentibacter sp.]|jgi:YggT family protein|nr:YggT family protein [Sedimentibacter sp.]HHY99516.1 YggT family protein [Tissierellia bacterium]HOK50105.1 YggT family protein [Sedimentibacter sp.]HOW22193.1 YggT family protein [Sedimentibacter sp.]HRC80842.1 YggT family protein [Sedimentibacter sp.]